MIVNSFQGIVHNWHKNMSPNIKKYIIEVYVKNNLRIDIEIALYKLTNLRICSLCNFKSFFCEFNEYYYELYDSTKN